MSRRRRPTESFDSNSGGRKKPSSRRPASRVISFGFGGRFVTSSSSYDSHEVDIRRLSSSTFLPPLLGNSCEPDLSLVKKAILKLDNNAGGKSSTLLKSAISDFIDRKQRPFSESVCEVLSCENMFCSMDPRRSSMSDDRIQTNKSYDELEKLIRKGDHRLALDLCLKEKMWSPALILSNFMGASIYRKVLKDYSDDKFIGNSSTKVFFGRLLTGSTTNADTEDWETSLATIIANRVPHGNNSKRAEILGDYLAQTDTCASHLCYLSGSSSEDLAAAERHKTPFKSSSTNSSSLPFWREKIVLIGGDANLVHSKAFLSLFSLYLTECWLFASGESYDWFDPYRLVTAMFLADEGNLENAMEFSQTLQGGNDANSYVMQLKIFQHRLRVFMGDAEPKWDDDLWSPDTLLEGDSRFYYGEEDSFEVQQLPPERDYIAEEEDRVVVQEEEFYGEKEEEEMSHAIQEDTVVETLAQADPFSAMAPPPIRRPVQVPPLQPRRIVEPIYQPRPNTRVEGKQITENDEPISPPEGNVGERVVKRSTSADLAEPQDAHNTWRAWATRTFVGVPKDATVANMGKKLEARYDPDMKRWIFPEDENSDDTTTTSAPPSSFPPPTLMASDGPPPFAGGPREGSHAPPNAHKKKKYVATAFS